MFDESSHTHQHITPSPYPHPIRGEIGHRSPALAAPANTTKIEGLSPDKELLSPDKDRTWIFFLLLAQLRIGPGFFPPLLDDHNKNRARDGPRKNTRANIGPRKKHPRDTLIARPISSRTVGGGYAWVAGCRAALNYQKKKNGYNTARFPGGPPPQY